MVEEKCPEAEVGSGHGSGVDARLNMHSPLAQLRFVLAGERRDETLLCYPKSRFSPFDP